MIKKRLALSIILILYTAAQAFAGGSFQFDTDLEPLLNQKPELKRLILKTFDLADSGYTPSRIGRQVNKKFGGHFFYFMPGSKNLREKDPLE